MVIDQESMLKRLRENEQCRFSFMRHPAQVPHSFLYFPGVKTFHHKDGVMSEVEHPNDAVYGVWNSVRKYLQKVIGKEFGDKERKHWYSYMRVHFSSPDIWRDVYKAIHSEGGESLLQILKSFRSWERGAVNEKVVVCGDWSPNSFSFCHKRNDECVMNGGILFMTANGTDTHKQNTMKARLYHDTRKKFRDYVDAWSMYFPYPKWLREQEHGTRGCFLGCRPTEYGMDKCTWEYDEPDKRLFLGKRVDVSTTPKAFQDIFKHYEKLWNEAITKNTEEAWNKWNLA